MAGLNCAEPTYLAARLLGLVVYAACRAKYRVEAEGLANYTCSPATVVVFNHRRDADAPIIANLLFKRHPTLGLERPLAFMGREDMFRTGFLTRYLEAWPWPLRALFSPLNLRSVLRLLRIYPMRRIAERSLGEVLETVLAVVGDVPLEQVLKSEWTQAFERIAGVERQALTVRYALRNRFRALLWQSHGLTKLSPRAFRAIETHERAVIEGQLRFFVDILNQGGTVVMAPEGAVSEDGRLARFRTGLHVLLARSHAPVRVLPVGITYDFTTSGRQRVFVNVGSEILGLEELKPRQMSLRVTQALLQQVTITASQLASVLLTAKRSSADAYVSAEELGAHVAAEAGRWREAGLHVDPRLLSASGLRQRVGEYVQYCLRAGILRASDGGRYLVSKCDLSPHPSWLDSLGAIDYCVNELASLAQLRQGGTGR